MTYKQQSMWDLLAKQLSGTLTAAESAKLKRLMRGKDEEAIAYMLHVLRDYLQAVQQAPETKETQQIIDRNKARLMDRIAKDQLTTRRTEERPARWFRKSHSRWAAAAAVGIVLLGAAFYFSRQVSPAVHLNVVTTEHGSKSRLTLPDGTEVWLNADSRLSYPSDFKNTTAREVTLSGEAYFKVKHNADHPFIIHTRYLNIRDLGTAFNVRAYPEEDRSEATLLEGSITVSLKADPGQNLHLQPGEKILYYASDHKLVRDHPSKQPDYSIVPLPHQQKLKVSRIQPVVVRPGDTVVSEIAWMNDQLVFNNTSFSELAQRMGRYYNTEIIIKDKTIAGYSFTGIFEGEQLEQALKELQMIRPFHYTMDNKKVIIKP